MWWVWFRLLEKDAEARLTVEEALQHPWLSQDESAPAPLLSSIVVERLRSFTRTTRLERLLLNVAANQLSNKEIDRLADMFRALDFDSDGCAAHAETGCSCPLGLAAQKPRSDYAPASVVMAVWKHACCTSGFDKDCGRSFGMSCRCPILNVPLCVLSWCYQPCILHPGVPDRRVVWSMPVWQWELVRTTSSPLGYGRTHSAQACSCPARLPTPY